LRKSGLTTSRSGDLVLSDAEETLKRRSLERQQDPLSSSLRPTSPDAATTPNLEDRTTVTGPILTVNSVSNPAAARRIDRSPAPSVGDRRQMSTTGTEHRRTHSTSSQRRYSFDDESQQFDWSATLNLISRLDDPATTTRQRPEPVDTGRRVRSLTAEPSIVSTRVERSTNWETTLPAYVRGKPNSANSDDWRSRTLSGQRGYSSDSEDSTAWLDRQRRKLHQRTSSASSTSAPTTSTIKARIVYPPPRTELERRLVDELKASHERLNLDSSSRGRLYASSTLPLPLSSSSLFRGRSLTNGFYDQSFSAETRTLPGRGRMSDGGVQRANSELDFNVDKTRRGHTTYDDVGFDKHRSLTSLRGGDNFVDQSLMKTTLSRRSGLLLIVLCV